MVAGMKNGEIRLRTTLEQNLVLTLDHLEAADSAPDVHTETFRLFLANGQLADWTAN